MGGTSDQSIRIGVIVEAFVGRTGGLISALRAVQDEFGFIPPETQEIAAAAFNLSRAEVKGVLSFYSDFRRKPPGRVVVRLCAAESCQAQGGRELVREISRRFALSPGNTSASGDLTLENVYCLGLCSVGPAASVDDCLMARAAPEAIAAAIEEKWRSQKGSRA